MPFEAPDCSADNRFGCIIEIGKLLLADSASRGPGALRSIPEHASYRHSLSPKGFPGLNQGCRRKSQYRTTFSDGRPWTYQNFLQHGRSLSIERLPVRRRPEPCIDSPRGRAWSNRSTGSLSRGRTLLLLNHRATSSMSAPSLLPSSVG